MAIAKVEPLTTARALRGPFDYRLPHRLADVGVGSLLVVPFGRRRLLGVVVGIEPTSALPANRLVEPIEALEAGVPPELVRLGLWIARQYCSTPARGLGLVLPPGTGTSGRGAAPRTELVATATAAGRAALAGAERLGSRQRATLEALCDAAGEGAGGEASAAGNRATLRRLEARGLVALDERRLSRRPAVVQVGARGGRPELSAEQRRAVEAIVAGLDGAAEGRELLLHGITGSGKTEVYLAAAERAADRGRGTIALVPEIALTPQTLARFAARFGDRVAVLHSGLTDAERRDEWERVRSGAASVCVGPRSAVFAPVRDLGLVVIDEEHDSSYKQEADPRYDARDVARRRARDAGAVMVAGSATPRPESWVSLRRLELSHRADGAALPAVEVLDMRERDGRSGPLHPATRAALAGLRERGGKAIVLLNRRGWSPFLSCRSCGRAWECPDCDVSLVVHRDPAMLRCHHCGHREPAPSSCPGCGSVTLARHGLGTERATELVAAAARPLPVFRLDSDSAAARGAHVGLLREFEEAEAGVLVGTQMVAKGHDFPDVVLGVVLDADATLRFPDFRAEERTFALVAQLAGRSGRGAANGRVLVQTLAPDAPAIRFAAAHDAAGFLAGEVERRRALRYPPFADLVRVELSAPQAEAAERAAQAVAARLRPALPPGTGLLGPAPRMRLRGRHRRQLLLKADAREATLDALRVSLDEVLAARELRGAALSVDVDPH